MIGAIILSHKRPNNVKTINALRNAGFTGPIKLLCDTKDETLGEYKKIYGDDIITFDKVESLKMCDTMDNFNKTNIVLPARNKCNDVAKKLGWDYFFELDDDYNMFDIRYEKNGQLKSRKIKELDDILNWIVDFLERSKALVVCFSQAGDYIGGVQGTYIHKGLTRKAMNCYVVKTENELKFIGSLNEDTNMYVTKNMRGGKSVQCEQPVCKSNHHSKQQWWADRYIPRTRNIY